MMRTGRALLVGTSGVLALSCVVSEPPGYVPPELERPNLLMFDAKPPVTQILIVKRDSSTVSIRIPIEFVPATEPIRWQLWNNFDLDGEDFLLGGRLGASDTEIAFDWRPKSTLSVGCQQLTLLVAHDSSLGSSTGDVEPEILVRDDVATATWWLNVDPEAGKENTLENCPGQKKPSL